MRKNTLEYWHEDATTSARWARFINVRSLILMVLLWGLLWFDGFAFDRFEENNFEGRWGDVRLAANRCLFAVVGLGLAMYAWLLLRRKIVLADVLGMATLAFASFKVLVRFVGMMRFLHPEWFA